MKKAAVIDLGSNSVRLVIFEVFPKGFKVIDDLKESVRLEEGLDDFLNLSSSSMDKAILTLKMFRSVCCAYEASVIAVATAAVRKAHNGGPFLQRIEKETGIKVRMITGEEEAYFDYLGVINSIEVTEGIIIDIGGGSTELILMEGKQLKEAVSFPFGSIDLTRKFQLDGHIHPENISKLKAFLKESFKKVPWLEKGIKGPLIGVGGMIRNIGKIGKIDRRKKAYPLNIAHNYEITYEDVCEIYQTVKKSPPDSRDSIDGLSAERADIFFGANAAVKTLMEVTGIRKFVTSGFGLREGLIFHYYCNLTCGPESVLDNSLENIMRLYQVDQGHARQVYRLYVKLVSALNDARLDKEDLSGVNRVAALLHDIGVNIQFYNHHEHTFYLILNSGLNGISHRELILSAYIAASHRNEKFKFPLETYQALLTKGDKILMRKAGVLLQIANSLDRSLDGKVKELTCQVAQDAVVITIEAKENSELEKKEAGRAAENFRKAFNRELIIN